ncbi:MAG: sigma 54-interacting transcriptional regulator [Bacteriovoracaceae bacterium]
MIRAKIIQDQIKHSGVRIGDSCLIMPFYGKKKAFTLNRNCIDLVSQKYRSGDISKAYVELPAQSHEFHYRLELDQTSDEGRFILKTIKGSPFWLNGLAAKEAYVERLDRLFIDDNKINFDSGSLEERVKTHFDHPVLSEKNLIESDLKILIVGETGTGKSHLASKIHEYSGKHGPFVSINLSSYNPQIIESELFGHVKGSFTGAIQDKNGAFALAENGTLFLDEIDSLPLDLQTKLLTFLDNKKFRKVGGVKETEIKTRLIFASGRPLENLVERGEFRKDFYFRLKSGFNIELKPLRFEGHRIEAVCQQYSLDHQISFSKRLIEFYQTLAWPGNLRQLYGHLEKKKILSKVTKLDFDQVDEELLLQSSDLMTIKESANLISLEEHKLKYVKHALNLCDGSLRLTARKLRVTEQTVRNMLAKI